MEDQQPTSRNKQAKAMCNLKKIKNKLWSRYVSDTDNGYLSAVSWVEKCSCNGVQHGCTLFLLGDIWPPETA